MPHFYSVKDLVDQASTSKNIQIFRISQQNSPQTYTDLLNITSILGRTPDFLAKLRFDAFNDTSLLLSFPTSLFRYPQITTTENKFKLAQYITHNKQLNLLDNSDYLDRAIAANLVFEYIESCSSCLPVLLARLEDLTLMNSMLITDKLNTLARLP